KRTDKNLIQFMPIF
uniref:Uncharacterized protein n=1 Tax=Solanum lycopersicum TaxID=4081 RepID=A0A3Q7GDJ2_SOLLC